MRKIYANSTILMALPSSVMVGSRALGVARNGSDMDICILESEIPKNVVLGTFKRRYGDQSLLLSKADLYTQGHIDIFVFANESDLTSVRTIMAEMVKWPRWLLEMKWFRVKLFRYKLAKAGF